MIYGHWSAGNYYHVFSSYHKCIYLKEKEITVCHFQNADKDMHGHTFMRNTNSVSICISCCVGAQTNNLGYFPPLPGQIKEMISLVADICCQQRIQIGRAHV